MSREVLRIYTEYLVAANTRTPKKKITIDIIPGIIWIMN